MNDLLHPVSASNLEGRLLPILDPHRNDRNIKRKARYTLLIAAVLVLIPCALVRLGYAEDEKSQKPARQNMAIAAVSNASLSAADRPKPQNPLSSTASSEPPLTKLAAADAIVEGVGWKEARVGMKREDLIKAMGKPDGDPSSNILKWADKHIDCTFHTGSPVVSEVRFNEGFKGALTNGIKLGSSGDAMLKLYGEPEYVIDPRNGAREYEYSSKGVLFWTNQRRITQIVVFKPYQLPWNRPKPAARESADVYRALAADAKLTEAQRLYCQWDAKTFGLPDPAPWKGLSVQDKAAAEDRFLEQLSSSDEKERVEAIDALAALGSKKAVRPILQIAADRREKNNWDRHTACRALGMLGDSSVVPELVHLTYHYNWNTRQWAQISLVRLTGENFGRNLAEWKQWWEKQGGKPPISSETIAWATSARMLSMLHGAEDPKKQEEMDRRAVEMIKAQGASEELKKRIRRPQIVSITPPNGAEDVDPALREIRVTFDMPMGRGFSWTGGGPEFPQSPEGKRPFWTEDRKTCVLPAELAPGRKYRLGLNSPSFKNFQSEAGVPLEPVVYTFSTRDQ